jgi:hypothetical protein
VGKVRKLCLESDYALQSIDWYSYFDIEIHKVVRVNNGTIRVLNVTCVIL